MIKFKERERKKSSLCINKIVRNLCLWIWMNHTEKSADVSMNSLSKDSHLHLCKEQITFTSKLTDSFYFQMLLKVQQNRRPRPMIASVRPIRVIHSLFRPRFIHPLSLLKPNQGVHVLKRCHFAEMYPNVPEEKPQCKHTDKAANH